MLKRLLIIAIVAAVLLSVLNMGARLLMDADKLKDIVVAQAKLLTGQELTIRGTPSLDLLPAPTLTLPIAEFTAQNNAPHLRADAIKVNISWFSMFSAVPSLSGLLLVNPVLEVKHDEGGFHPGWLGALSGIASEHGLGNATVEGGKIIITDAKGEPLQRIENVSLNADSSRGGAEVSGGFSYMTTPLQLRFSLRPSEGVTLIDARVWQNDSTYASFKGKMLMKETISNINGDMEAKLDDLHNFVQGIGEPGKPYPVSLTSQLNYIGDRTILENLSLETADSSGKGSINFISGVRPVVDTSIAFTRLVLPAGAIAGLFKAPPATTPELPQLPVTEPTLPKNLDITFNMTAEDLLLGEKKLTGSIFKGKLVAGNFSVEILQALLPENGAIALSGNVQETAKGIRFQGRADARGGSMKSALGLFSAEADQLPERGLGAFSLSSNIFISSEQLRLSEADVRLENLQLVGGMVTYFEEKPRIEADIALRDTNLDYFRNSWRSEQIAKGTAQPILKLNTGVDFGWLKHLRPIVSLKVGLEGFTFLDKTGGKGSFKILAQQNELALQNIELVYPDGTFKSNLKLNVEKDQPVLDITAEIPQLDTNYFSVNPQIQSKPLANPNDPAHRWSEELFDFSWLEGYNGNFALGIRDFTHAGGLYKNFTLAAQLQNEQVQFSRLSFEHFGGKVDATGTLTGGKVPSLSASYTLYNADIVDLLHSFTKLDKIGGRVSVSGTIVTSGINFLAWLEQADIKTVIAARGVKLPGFYLQGIVDGVNASRSVAEVVTNVQQAMPAGVTDVSVDGNINIQKAIVKTPGLTLKTVQAGGATGVLTGEWQLMPWTLKMALLWQLPVLKSETVPTLSMDIDGTPENYNVKTDTSSLEAYVAKRIVGK